jgi:hypothetical protein
MEQITAMLYTHGVSNVLFNENGSITLNPDDVEQLIEKADGIKLNSTSHPFKEPGQPIDEIEIRLAAVLVDSIAKMAHEINRAYCLALGDGSQPEWKDAPEWQKDSARKGVQFHMSNPDATPENSHEEWLKVKAFDGWVYGETKDPEKKIHPCMKPYRELPRDQRVKDYLFRAVVHSLRD